MEWIAYDKIEPIGQFRQDYNMALLCSVVTNLFLATRKKKGQKLEYTAPSDFMPQWGAQYYKEPKTDKKQSVEDMKAILMGIASSFNKKRRNG